MSRPLPDHLTRAHPTTTTQQRKGSDHDRNEHDTEDRKPTGDGETNGDGTSNDDRADSRDGGDQPDTDRPRLTWQSTTVDRSEPNAGGSAPSKRDDAPVTLTAGPGGVLWVAVDGADVHEVAARINAACDALLRAQPFSE